MLFVKCIYVPTLKIFTLLYFYFITMESPTCSCSTMHYTTVSESRSQYLFSNNISTSKHHTYTFVYSFNLKWIVYKFIKHEKVNNFWYFYLLYYIFGCIYKLDPTHAWYSDTKFFSDLWQVSGFLWVLRFPGSSSSLLHSTPSAYWWYHSGTGVTIPCMRGV
jgi:hypothetical protein